MSQVFVMKQEKRYAMYKNKEDILLEMNGGLLSNIEPKHGWWMAEYTYDIPVPFNPACLDLIPEEQFTKGELMLIKNLALRGATTLPDPERFSQIISKILKAIVKAENKK